MINKRTVLFVDDEETILRSLKRYLLDEPYNKLFAMSGREALEILKKEKVHVVVTDIRMPGMDGLELLKIVKEMYPQIVNMVLSGYADLGVILQAIDQGNVFKFILKPWNPQENFNKVILEAIDRYNLQSECDSVKQHN
jgi:two-component system response regulator HupR/HoxA